MPSSATTTNRSFGLKTKSQELYSIMFNLAHVYRTKSAERTQVPAGWRQKDVDWAIRVYLMGNDRDADKTVRYSIEVSTR